MKYFKVMFFITIIFSILPSLLIAQQGSMDWTQATDSAGWTARREHASVVFDNKLWVLGGATDDVSRTNDVWYSSDGTRWLCATDSAGWARRRNHASVVFDNKIWILGGTPRTNDVWYSLDGDSWIRATNAAGWARRDGHAAVVFDNKMWVLGGYATPGARMNDVWYSTNGISWTRACSSAAWSRRDNLAAVVFDNKIWVLGGYAALDGRMNDVWYSTDGVNWICATDSAGWSAREQHTATVFDNKIWVLGGNGSRKNDVWYSSDGANWTQATNNAGWTRRYDHTANTFNNRIWIMGGNAQDGNFKRDVWFSKGLMATLISPNGSDTLFGASSQIIRWRTNCTTYTNIRLLFSKDGGLTYDDTIARNILPSETTYQWTLPYVNSKQCRVMVQIIDSNTVRVQDASDIDFTIQTVYIISPNGGEVYSGGTNQIIQWRTYYPINLFYRLLLSHDYIETDTIADNLTLADTLYNWTVPLINCEYCHVIIQMKDSSGNVILEDSSDNQFTVQTIALLTPNGDEYWAGGSNKLIRWRTFTQVGFSKYQLLLSIDGGQTFSDTIADSLPPTETTYVWPVPLINSSSCQAKIEILDSINEVLCYDISDGYFVIDAEPPSVFSLLSPPNFGWTGKNAAFTWEPASDNFWLSHYQLSVAIPNETLTANTYISTYFPGGGTNWSCATMNAEWSGRWLHTSVVFDNKMWVMGGEDEDDVRNDIWYSIDGTNWIEAISSANWSPRAGHSSVVFDNKMWIIGGYNYDYGFNDVWYSSDGVNWICATETAPWTKRSGHTSVVFDNRMWILGGYDNVNTVLLNDVWYSLDGINWTQTTASAQWGPRDGHTSVVFDNKMWVIGGNSDDVWYSTDGITWTCATDSAIWGNRYFHTSVVFDNKMWVIGGNSDDVWHSTDGINWICATTSAGWSARQGHTSVVYDNKIWVIGGDYLNDVWYSGLPLHIPQGLHHWWVTAFDRAGNSRRSTETFSVRVDTIYPTIPNLISPNDSASINDSVVIFKWHRAFDIPSGILGYRLQVCINSFLDPMIDTLINDTLTTIQLNDSTYKWRVCAVDSGGNRSGWSNVRTFTFHAVGIEENSPLLSALRLSLNVYPNPANTQTSIRYSLPAKSKVSLVMYDITGRQVKSFVNGQMERGIYTNNLKTDDFSAGVYFIILRVVPKKILISRLVIAK